MPIDLSTLFEKKDSRLPGFGNQCGLSYTRWGNPTRTAFEVALSTIHQVNCATITNNIRAAYYAISLMFVENDEIIVISKREKFVDNVKQAFECQNMGLKLTYVPYTEGMTINLTPKTKCVIAEKA